jgi:hypothetical protein
LTSQEHEVAGELVQIVQATVRSRAYPRGGENLVQIAGECVSCPVSHANPTFSARFIRSFAMSVPKENSARRAMSSQAEEHDRRPLGSPRALRQSPPARSPSQDLRGSGCPVARARGPASYRPSIVLAAYRSGEVKPTRFTTEKTRSSQARNRAKRWASAQPCPKR